jgi:hypothetical protein
MPILQGGGAGSPLTPNHVIRKWMVNWTLAVGHQADLAHCFKLPAFHATAVHQVNIVHYYYFDWGRRQ